MTERLKKIIDFLNKEFGEVPQCFDTKNTVGDPMETIYNEDDVRIDYCYRYDYIEVFGLNEEEFNILYNLYETNRYKE